GMGVLMSRARPRVPPSGQHGQHGRDDQRPAVEAFHHALAIALPASLLVHLAATGWVYTVAFHLAYLGPVFLAVGVSQPLLEAGSDGAWPLRIPAAAILLSLGAPDALLLHGPLGVPISPLRLTLSGAGLVYLLGFRLHQVRACAWAAGFCLVGAAAGH